MGTLTKNFDAYEFRCRCGKCIYSNGNGINRPLVSKLQRIRDIYGHSMPINSGCRCEAHNRAIGGARFSQHAPAQGCRAADIGVTDPAGRVIIIREALNLGLSVGLNDRFVHLDNRLIQRIFLY